MSVVTSLLKLVETHGQADVFPHTEPVVHHNVPLITNSLATIEPSAPFNDPSDEFSLTMSLLFLILLIGMGVYWCVKR